MRKVIWPNRKQMLTYTSVVLAFLAFMVALVGLADLGLTKLVHAGVRLRFLVTERTDNRDYLRR